MNAADIPFLSTGELSRLIEGKEVSPVEATEAYLARIDALDFKFNAYLTVSRREALAAARDAEEAVLRGEYLGPMHGIPVAVKDQLWTKGVRTTGGSRVLADFFPDRDSTVVANLKKAGAVILGKTNMTELAIGGPHRYSQPRNPWDLDAYPGRSSSGSGVATSAYLCSTSIGEDTGGSIRIPAAFCGVVGLRPTWGLVSRHGLMPGAWSMDTAGPISRTVEDAVITLGAIAGHDPRDPHTWTVATPDFRQSLNGDVKALRIGIVKEQIDSDIVAPDVRTAVLKATSVLGELGAVVEEVSIPHTAYANSPAWGAMAIEPAINYRQWARERLHEFGRGNRAGLLLGSIIPAQAYYKAQKLRALLRGQVLDAFERYDVLALPTAGRPASHMDDDPVVTDRLPSVQTALFNLASCPAISVPCGLSPQGMPIALQLGARPGGDETIIRAAHAYERHTEWHTKRPPFA